MDLKSNRLSKAEVKAAQELRREQRLILKELKIRGALTIPEISETTGLETWKVLKNLIALNFSGKVNYTGIKGDYYLYDLVKEG